MSKVSRSPLQAIKMKAMPLGHWSLWNVVKQEIHSMNVQQINLQ